MSSESLPDDDISGEEVEQSEPSAFVPVNAQLYPLVKISEQASALGVHLSKKFMKQFGSTSPFDSERIARSLGIPKMPKDLMPKLFPALGETLKALEPYLAQLREKLPPNWPRGIDFDKAAWVIQEEGIPLVWVPRVEIVDYLLDAPDRSARLDILLEHKGEIVDDCLTVLNGLAGDLTSGQVPLAAKAVTAFAAGHVEAAQVLAVVVTETAVTKVFPDHSYKRVRKTVKFEKEQMTIGALRMAAALAAIAPFYTSWYPRSKTPPPEELSRHVTVHFADQEHYTLQNAVVAVLLVTSILRAMEDSEAIAALAADDEN
ncbi:hypothetical protein [Catelliglobosispora koreensis]|uniref:hypothetical protein n=1 Tax=Catelliglobosispora koreensis TaxID=129052 RepID=UPI000372CF91|nr:hypothetical protein [Catelliglobosispora koreensis]